MSTFIDTSALYALLDRDDNFHQAAKVTWQRLIRHDEPFSTSNYVVLESVALVQNRLGMQAVKSFHEDILPMLHLAWIDTATHWKAMNTLLTVSRRNLSLVDCTSFEVMHTLGLQRVFAFDVHFREQGFFLVHE